MRIGIFDYANSGQRSGVEYYALGLIRCLAARLDPGHLIVYTNDPNAVLQLNAAIVVRKVPGRQCRTLRLYWQHFRLPRRVEADGLDVFHCPAYVMPLLQSRVPCVITVHDTHALCHPEWCSFANRLHYGFAIPRSLHRAAGIIAVSEDTRASIVSGFGLQQSDISVIMPGIDDIFTATPDPAAEEECRRKYRLPDRYILHVGNIELRKNISVALAATRRLAERGIHRKLVLAGHIRSRRLRRLLHGAQKGGLVHLLGYVDRYELPCIYRMAEAVLSVSYHEGFGFPALEAMACGTPVVSSMAGAMRQTLEGAAMPADPDDERSVADALTAVIDDRTLRSRISEAGVHRAKNFRWDRCATDLLDVYRDAASRTGKSGRPT